MRDCVALLRLLHPGEHYHLDDAMQIGMTRLRHALTTKLERRGIDWRPILRAPKPAPPNPFSGPNAPGIPPSYRPLID